MYKCVMVSSVTLLIGLACVVGQAQDSTDGGKKPVLVQIADDSIQLTAPGTWEKVQPGSSMVEVELAVPKIGDDPKNGRITIMRAGGSVAANVERWVGQFKNADGSPVADVQPTVSEVSGQKVHLVDISGTFAESMGPASPKTDRPNYRMLGAIIETKEHGTYFIKFYGPKPTIDANAEGFQKMIMGLKLAGADAAAPEPIVFTVAAGDLAMTAPGQWTKTKPRSSMLEAEFQIPKVGEDESDGRLTIMGAGGSIDANIDRWIGQFTTDDGSPLSGVEPTVFEIAGQKIHLIDLSGTFIDSMGAPGGPTTDRKNYRMLGAIIETEDLGNYFVKFYGPRKTIDANAAAFKQMLESLKITE